MRSCRATLLMAALPAFLACGDRGAPPAAPSAPAAPAAPAAGVPAPPGPRVLAELAARSVKRPPILFIGLDGADWRQLDPLLAAGSMPNLARLRSEAAWGELETESPALSPLLWTSMLTGVSPVEHGILDFSRFHPQTGVREPITSEERRAPAIWNDLTWAGKRVDLLGMWATHPAETVDGIVVSDRLFGFLNVEAAPPPGAIFPESRASWAAAELASTERATGYESLRSYLPWLTEAGYREHAGAARAYDHPISALRRILVETRLYGGLAESILADTSRPAPDLLIVYLQGTDSIGHVFAPFAPPRQARITETEFERYRAVPERYFRELDALLGRLFAAAARHRAAIVVASDHGFFWDEDRPTDWASSDAKTAARWHREQGIWLVHGGGVARQKGAPGKLRQIFPTLLSLAGLPAAVGAESEPLAALAPPAQPAFDYGRAFRAQAVRRFESRPRSAATAATVASAASAAAATAADRALQEEMAKLRALGYIGAGESTRADAAALAAGSTRTASSYNNEGIVLRGENRAAAARAAFEKAVELEPQLASALWNLSDLLFAAGDLEPSDELLARALASGLPDGTKLVVGRAIHYERTGGLSRALGLLDRSLLARPEAMELWLHRGRYRIQDGACRDAAGDLARAAALAPENPDVFATAALAHLCAGDRPSALSALRRALALSPGDARLAALLRELDPPG
jgi:predicted AlkP superfamily pyrophosphatase or phosphodiesterase/Tfp pilus assembly protein PilF